MPSVFISLKSKLASMYIVFEGIVGSGKSTQSARLYEYLLKKYPDKRIIRVREPGSTGIAEAIRKLAQGTQFDEAMDPICEAYLFAAARAQLLKTIVKPAVDAGGIVIADRSFISSLAYQGRARWLGLDKVLAINHAAINDVLPDKVVYLDSEVEHALDRTFDLEGDKFEQKWVEFFEKVTEWYKKSSKLAILRNKWVNIDAKGSVEEVFDRIVKALHL